MITKWSDVFSQHDLDLGQAKDVTRRIKLKEDTVFKERPRRIPPTMIDEVRTHLQEMVGLGGYPSLMQPFRFKCSNGA